MKADPIATAHRWIRKDILPSKMMNLKMYSNSIEMDEESFFEAAVQLKNQEKQLHFKVFENDTDGTSLFLLLHSCLKICQERAWLFRAVRHPHTCHLKTFSQINACLWCLLWLHM